MEGQTDKRMTAKKPETAPPPAGDSLLAPLLVRGDFFYARRIPLPEGLDREEIASLVSLRLEESAPFPLEQLYHGFRLDTAGAGIFLFAAYRRRFSNEDQQRWTHAALVLPDFGPALDLRFEEPTLLLLHGVEAGTALWFPEAGQGAHGCIGRPWPEDCTAVAERSEWLAALGRRLLNGVEEAAVVAFAAPRDLGEERGARRFGFCAPVEGPAAAAPADPDAPADAEADPVKVSPSEEAHAAPSKVLRQVTFRQRDLWLMDIREEGMLQEKIKRATFDRYAWRGLLGLAAALVVLLLGELLLGAFGLTLRAVSRDTQKRGVEVAEIQRKHEIVNRLQEFEESNLLPFQMLAIINPVRPRSVYFTRAATEGVTGLVVEASTRNVADVNEYETRLRNLGQVRQVEVRNLNSRAGGTTFTLVLDFSPSALVRPAGRGPGPLETASRPTD
ncbi:MAG: hypothetical protein EA425_08870 [Puniceicoccaceae bacterium]|nr:MAG: hypothetical protein EA425_08870 [Puniceicoccaceae bacterium]